MLTSSVYLHSQINGRALPGPRAFPLGFAPITALREITALTSDLDPQEVVCVGDFSIHRIIKYAH